MRVRNVSKVLALALAAVSLPAAACAYPDEGNMPLRRAVSRVKYLPETEAWAAAMHKAGRVVHYALLLERERHRNGRCYWTVEARAQGMTWRRFYITPDGVLLSETADRPRAAGR
jgi:hypothetical protein